MKHKKVTKLCHFGKISDAGDLFPDLFINNDIENNDIVLLNFCYTSKAISSKNFIEDGIKLPG